MARDFYPGTYGENTAAFIDSFAGLVPCVVLSIGEQISVRVTGNLGPYHKGEKLAFAPSTVVPRDRVFTRGYHYRINTQYAWVKPKPAETHADYCRPESPEGCTCWRATQRLNAHSMKVIG